MRLRSRRIDALNITDPGLSISRDIVKCAAVAAETRFLRKFRLTVFTILHKGINLHKEGYFIIAIKGLA